MVIHWESKHKPDGIKRVRGKTCSNSDTPAEEEGREEVALQCADKDHRLCGVVSIVASEKQQATY
jgi:hypothetical protein